MESDDLQLLKDGFVRIDKATTKAATAASAIGTRIGGLMGQITANAGNAEVVKGLATQAGTEAASLETLADSLTQMGSDPSNPVPVEPPVVAPAVG